MTPPAGLPPQQRDALLAVASHCTVHNTLTTRPAVDVRLVFGKVDTEAEPSLARPPGHASSRP